MLGGYNFGYCINSRAYTTKVYEAECEQLNQLFKEMEKNAYPDLEKEGVSKEDVHLERRLDMKYDGAKIEVGNRILGPAIVKEEATTIVVIQGLCLELDGRDFYIMTFKD
jgi:N-methylhydantoinase A/oxoprolinase/acetone carboxylase beta subunit